MSSILVRNIDKATLEALQQRAAAHRRSLQKELREILEEAAAEEVRHTEALRFADEIRAAVNARAGTLSDSAEIVRDDRER